MKLVANRINQTHLRDILPTISEDNQVDSVLAAIAYGSSASDETQDLVGHSLKNKLRLDLWMRYDETVPVSIPLLKRLLKNIPNNIFTQFVPDCFHAKVIWWKGYGAYIGSANHTDRGWLTNIEAGVFVDEDEMSASDMDIELEGFFDNLRNLDICIPISESYIAEMERLQQLGKNAYTDAKKAREHDYWEGPAFVAKKAAFDRRKENFKTEWLNTLGILESIQKQLPDYRPAWVEEAAVPTAWQVDQFLHAYYYNRLGDRLRKPFEDEYQLNKGNPGAKVNVELKWWQAQTDAPSNEDVNLYDNAPLIRRLCQQDSLLTLKPEEMAELFFRTHATLDHLIKIPCATLGRPDLTTMSREERIHPFTALVMKARNKKGWDVRQLLSYVLHEGPDNLLWERLYNAGRNPEYRLPRYGLNSIAEIVGWAKPEVVPPRNGRTSKALKALGFNVKIY